MTRLTDYERLTLQLRIAEVSMLQVDMELRHRNYLDEEIAMILEETQENITLIADDILNIYQAGKRE